MNELQVKLEQAKQDRDKIEQEVDRLTKEIAQKVAPKFGDIVLYHGENRRVVLYNETGNLCTFRQHAGRLHFTDSDPSRCVFKKTDLNIATMLDLGKY